jgi:hypothetical protein
MCCGDTNICLYQPNLKRDDRADTQQSTTLDNTLKGICPWDHLFVWIHNTVADATKVNNPKSTRLLSTLMLAWEVHEREDEPEMADVLKNLVVPQKLAHIRPRRYKHDSINFLRLKWYLTIMPVIFYLNKRFFSAWHHPDSFSRGGECSKP